MLTWIAMSGATMFIWLKPNVKGEPILAFVVRLIVQSLDYIFQLAVRMRDMGLSWTVDKA